MENVNFKPWVGPKYSDGLHGKKIMILGDSHYCKDELKEGGVCWPTCVKSKMKTSCNMQTNGIVEEYLYDYKGQRYLQVFQACDRAYYGKESSQQEKEDFWNSVMFYNYFQNSQKGPSKVIEITEDAEIAFKEILEEYLPDLIIVWGKRLYNDYLPNWEGLASKIEIDENKKTDIRTYSIKGKDIHIMEVHHPNRGLGKSWEYWHPFYKKFIGY